MSDFKAELAAVFPGVEFEIDEGNRLEFYATAGAAVITSNRVTGGAMIGQASIEGAVSGWGFTLPDARDAFVANVHAANEALAALGIATDATRAEVAHLRAELAATAENLLDLKGYDAETDRLDREYMEAHGRDGNELERTALRARLEVRLGRPLSGLLTTFAMEAMHEVVKEDLAAMTPEARAAAHERVKAGIRAMLEERRRANAG